ncbi:MAG: nitrogenase [Coleofasciculaceae cyanobacterium RL_1_1]|nr:nitrogenase [Coleofasciculaceae cyanobacterium RL_1_1]
MSATLNAPSTESQSSAWLRGLLAIAWADGDFDAEERRLIAEIAHEDPIDELKPISPQELAQIFGTDTEMAENFLRTAVMVAVADGVYSEPEDAVLHDFCNALGVGSAAIDSLRHTLEPPDGSDDLDSSGMIQGNISTSGLQRPVTPTLDVLAPVRGWLDHLEMKDPKVARFLCKMIPAQCPFERDVKLFGDKVVHIPPMCKLNPLYEQLVGLRFRAMSYLADDCGEDVTPYC